MVAQAPQAADDGFQPLQWVARDDAELLERSREHLATMRTRRAVRQFSSRPVPLEVIENAVQVAGLAPNGSNCQPWTFCAVTGAETKRRIREAAEQVERETYERRMTAEWRSRVAPLGTSWRKPHLTEAPCLIVVFEQIYGWATEPDGTRRKVKHFNTKRSIGVATGFLISALHRAGLATLVHTPEPMGFLREVLGRPENEVPFCIVPCGHPADDCRVPRIAKKPLDEILVRYP